MNRLIDEAKELIEMSLESGGHTGDYSSKATDWLKRFEAVRKTHQGHDQEDEASCSICGFDLICPSCKSD
jgi:hypothetical protein